MFCREHDLPLKYSVDMYATRHLAVYHPAGSAFLPWLFLLLAATALAMLPVPVAALSLAGLAFVVVLLLEPVIGLYALVVCIPVGPVLRVPVGPASLGVTDLLVGATAAAWFVRQVVRRTPLRPAPLLWFLTPLSLALLYSTLPARSLEQALPELVKWGEVVVIYFLAVQLLSERQRLPFVLVLITAAAMESMVGLRQFVYRIGPDAYLLGSYLRAYGTFGQPNPFAGYLGLALPIALALGLWALGAALRSHEATRLRLLALAAYALAATAVITAGLFASWSRGAWLGAAAGVVAVLALISRAGRILVVAGAILALLAFPVLPAALHDRLADFARYFGTWNARGVPVNDANFSVLERVAHWQVAWEMFASQPWLGIGVGNWDVIYSKYAFGQWTEPMGHAHNALFHFAAEAGLAGAIAYLWFWLGSLGAALMAVHRHRNLQRAIGVGVFGLLVHLSVHNQFENLFVQGMPLLVALALALLSLEKRAGPSARVAS